MISVSPALKTEFEKLRGRHLTTRARIDYSDSMVDNTVIAWSGGTEINSYENQSFNGVEDIPLKWASLDGSWVLGGYALAPESVNGKEIGWWSSELSLPDNSFYQGSRSLYGSALYGCELLGSNTTYPEISINFSSRTISQIRISFDNSRLEWAEDFDVIFYDIDLSPVYTKNVTGNAGLKYIEIIATQNSIYQMTIRIKKWSSPNKNAKIAELFTSIFEVYNGADIMDLKVSENREIPEKGASLGSTASGQCTLSIFNRDGKFDYDNTTSKLYNVIRRGSRITLEIGDGTNWCPLGVFYASEWDIKKGAISATVTGVDRMVDLDESRYSISQILIAPSPEATLIDTNAEWNSGTISGLSVASNKIKLVV